MRKISFISFFAAVSALIFSLTTTVYAATATGTGTFDYSKYLPIVVGGTLIVEALIIILLSDIKRIVNVSFAVLVANIVSFFVIRIGLGVLRHETFYKGMITQGVISSNWIAAFIFLCVSLVTELPILYFMLRVFTKKTTRLMIIATVANILTVAATAVVELQINNTLIK